MGAVVVKSMLSVAQPAKVQPISAHKAEGVAVGSVMGDPGVPVIDGVLQVPLPALKVTVQGVMKV